MPGQAQGHAALVVRNLPADMDAEDLRAMLEQFGGAASDPRVVFNWQDKTLYGFANMATVQQASEVVKYLGKLHRETQCDIEVTFAKAAGGEEHASSTPRGANGWAKGGGAKGGGPGGAKGGAQGGAKGGAKGGDWWTGWASGGWGDSWDQDASWWFNAGQAMAAAMGDSKGKGCPGKGGYGKAFGGNADGKGAYALYAGCGGGSAGYGPAWRQPPQPWPRGAEPWQPAKKHQPSARQLARGGQDTGVGTRPAEQTEADLFVRALPKEMGSEGLAEMLSLYGEVVAARVVFNVKGQSSRYGFATMGNAAEAELAIVGLNGVDGLEVKLASDGSAPRRASAQAKAEV